MGKREEIPVKGEDELHVLSCRSGRSPKQFTHQLMGHRCPGHHHGTAEGFGPYDEAECAAVVVGLGALLALLELWCCCW